MCKTSKRLAAIIISLLLVVISLIDSGCTRGGSIGGNAAQHDIIFSPGTSDESEQKGIYGINADGTNRIALKELDIEGNPVCYFSTLLNLTSLEKLKLNDWDMDAIRNDSNIAQLEERGVEVFFND